MAIGSQRWWQQLVSITSCGIIRGNHMDQFEWPDPPRQTAFPIAKPGYPLIYAAAFITLVLAVLELTPLALIALLAALSICWFFRDPDRVVPRSENAVVSPADGKIVVAGSVEGGPLGEGRCAKISIFMTVFDVHVNRIPHEGTISKIDYRPGEFIPADRSRASRDNEQNAVFIDTSGGRQLCVVQVAGLIARRIICGIQAGDALSRGQRYGMICFGSRLDVYLPADTTLKVEVGDRVEAGSTILGYLS